MKKPKPNNIIPIGKYRLGCLNVSLAADPGLEGGHYDMTPQPTITVGLLHNSWGDVVSILLHEAFEMAMAINGHKHRKVPISSYDSADCLFLFDHPHFSRLGAEVGEFMADALPKLAAVYNKNCKKKGAKK